MSISSNLQTWVAAVATLGIFSFLIKENPFYRFFEYTVVGMAAAHTVVMTWDNYTKPLFRDYILKGKETYLIIPAAIGLLYYCRYMNQKISWLYRYPMSIILGYNIGYSLAYDPRPFLVQVRSTFESFAHINNYIFLAIYATTVAYFVFTMGTKNKTIGGAQRFARYVMMVYFGVSFGNTVQGRFSLLLGRLLFLLQDWLGIVRVGQGQL